MNKSVSIIALAIVAALGWYALRGQDEGPAGGEVQAYLDGYNQTFQELYTRSSEAQWQANIRIVEGDKETPAKSRAAQEAYAAFTGSVENIETARAYLARADSLDALQVKQLEAILYAAAGNPQTVPDVVKERIALEVALNDKLYGFDFQIDGKSVTPNEIDRILREETDLEARLKAWRASKEVGKVLREGLAEVRDLRNKTVQALGYSDFFSYQVSEYGMTTEEMIAMMQRINGELRPLFRELHTYARYELASRYGVDEVPDLIPAHWLPNRWGQTWEGMISVEGADLTTQLKDMTPEDVVRQAERFYVGLGFDPLPASFYEKSSLYPLPAGADYKKNNHASAWHMDLAGDVRSLMSVENNAEWYETTHHELGHIYYFMSYSTPAVPLVLRGGANRAFHEAIGSLMGFAASQKPFLAHIGLLPPKSDSDQMQALLKEAMLSAVFIPFATGLMTEFERDLYAGNLPASSFNARWWNLKARYQGIAPPSPRGEEYTDAASKTHIIDDAAQYYDYAMAYILYFQLHDYIAKNILKQDPRATNYFGSHEVGDFLKSIMAPGATRDWRKVMRQATGQELSAQPMIDYFAPLMAHLRLVNAGRTYTLPE